jgi:hypothetical protein
VTDDQLVAQARTAWETIGLPPLAPIDHRPLALNDALQAIMQSPPSEPADLVACWHRVAEDNPHLRDLPATGIAAYLSHQLFGTLFIAAQTDVPLPRLTVGPLAVGAPRASSPPFLFWAFSSRNALLKLQLVAALVLVVVVSILGAREFQGRRVRNAAYSSLQSARKAASLEPMLDAAEQFLSVRPFAVDARVAEVEALYSEALVRWFSETGPAPEVANSRIRRYGELLAITGSQER